MSKIYTAAVVIILTQAVEFFGLPVVPDQIETVATFLVTLGAAIVIAVARKAKGDITVAGTRK